MRLFPFGLYAVGMEQQVDPKSGGWKAWFAHAFAVDKPEAIDPTPQQREIIDRLCKEVARRELGMPALLALRMSQPLNVLAASALHILQPIISALLNPESITQFALFLEHRGSIDYLCKRIEHFGTARREHQPNDAAAGDAKPADREDHAT